MERIPISNATLGRAEAEAASRQILSGWVSMGARVREFEARCADYLGARHAIAFSNGTASLHAALLALGVGEGDEVIVPSLSYISSGNAVLYCGARPVFAEEDERTFNVDAEEIARKITDKTRAIMTVDLKGMPVDYDAINELAAARGIPVLADSAESFGARYGGELVGSQCDAHSFSFFANKNITMGEGGLVTTASDEIAEACRCVRNQGQSERYRHVILGHNYRLTDIAAAIGIEQLGRLEAVLDAKERIARIYTEHFSEMGRVEPPYLPPYVGRHSWYMYSIRFDQSVCRDDLRQRLDVDGIDTRLSFPPIPLQPYYRERFGYREGDFPRAERIFRSFLDIPCWAGMNDGQIERVISAVERGIS